MALEFLPLPRNLPPCHHTCDLSLPKQEQRAIGHGIIIVRYSKRGVLVVQRAPCLGTLLLQSFYLT